MKALTLEPDFVLLCEFIATLFICRVGKKNPSFIYLFFGPERIDRLFVATKHLNRI